MKRLLGLVALAGLVSSVVQSAQAQNLLINGTLDNPGVHESDVAVGWTLVEGPFVPGIPPDPDFNPNTATFASFADHTTEGVPGGVGLWLRAFTGTAEDPSDTDDEQQVFANLSQTVGGTAGAPYQLSAWSRFETHYAGGVDFLNAAGTDSSNSMDGLPSPTDTLLFIEFLDFFSAVLPGSVSVELRADGQANAAGWHQHVLNAVAPAGTVSVRVGGVMEDGVINPGVNPQSAFLDDFVLLQIPEPSTIGLGLVSLLGFAVLKRRR